MGIPVLIIGKSGSGKSRSLKNFSKEQIGIIKVVQKELPFKNNLPSIVSKNYSEIKSILMKSKANSLFIDDAGYLLTSEFMNKRDEKGYDKFNTLAFNYYDLIEFIQNSLPREKIVYLVMHEDENDITGEVKPKTIGKLLDEKVCVEGLFTIVIRCVNESGMHKFYVNNNGCAKTPEDMFEYDEVENDLKLIDDTIREYWNLKKEGE